MRSRRLGHARGAKGCSPASPAVRPYGQACKWRLVRNRRASGSSRSCRTRASATSRRHSSPRPDAVLTRTRSGIRAHTILVLRGRPFRCLPSARYAFSMLGIGTVARVAKELRRDVAVARDRDPAARGVAPVEIVATWPGIQALLAHRVAHALHSSEVPLLPRAIALCSRALTGIEIHPAASIGKG